MGSPSLAYASLGKDEEAVEDFSQAIHLNPKNPLWYFQRAKMYERCRYAEAVLEDLERVLELDPQFQGARELHKKWKG